MADASDEPIIAREAASLLDAHALYKKATRIVHSVVEVGKDRWPVFGWPKTANDADEQLLWQFKGHGRITLPMRTPTPAKLLFGIVQTDASAEFYKPLPDRTGGPRRPGPRLEAPLAWMVGIDSQQASRSLRQPRRRPGLDHRQIRGPGDRRAVFGDRPDWERDDVR